MFLKNIPPSVRVRVGSLTRFAGLIPQKSKTVATTEFVVMTASDVPVSRNSSLVSWASGHELHLFLCQFRQNRHSVLNFQNLDFTVP